MKVIFKYSFQFVILFGLTITALLAKNNEIHFQEFFVAPEEDSTKSKNKIDSLKFEIKDRENDKIHEDQSKQFDLKDPSNISTKIEYEPEDSSYSISEKIGKENYRNPTYMSMEEFLEYQGKKDMEKYWMKKANSLSTITKKGGIIPKVELGNAIFDRIFGGTGIEVKPSGNVDMFFGMNGQNIQNPAIILSQQRVSNFDFDLNMNINMLAKIGDKLKMNFNYNDKATFDFENQLKLEHTGREDEIIKKLEAGYISFPLKSQLIQGVQSLFGIKAQMQFGRLMMTNVLSQQKSKKESFQIKGGAQTTEFSIPSDQYDDFKHFFLAQNFRNNYNTALKNFPVIQSLNNVTRMDVWITNRTGVTQNARDVLALQDLGEGNPYRSFLMTNPNAVPDNSANNLYTSLLQNPNSRNVGTVVNFMQSINLKGTKDFEKTFARKLNPNEFSFNPQLGFLSLNVQLQPDDVVGVAYEYTNNGKVHQVGEFAQNLPPDTLTPKVLFLKMLKSTAPDPTVPLWDLMMKNVYSLGASGVSKESFILNVFYQDPGGGEKRYLPEGPKAGIPLINLLNLDRLNNQNDPVQDGRFDYVEGTTINSQQGKIIFPVLEPFGSDLKPVFEGNNLLEKKYVYQILYDSTKNIAIQFPQLNRYLIKGSFQSANSSEIYLGGFNIPQGSVNVSVGGQRLVENIDYTIDYGIGKLKIINAGILSSGVPINVSYENNIAFGTQVQNFVGSRMDYFINDNFTVGGTLLRLSERPFFNKVSFGDDPIKNTVVGLDANYQSELPFITKALNKLPIINTQSPSMITTSGEVARIFPGHSRFINGTSGSGETYIDDFEGSRSGYDLKSPIMAWSLASTPVEASDKNSQIIFPEASLVNNYTYGKNRAKLAWYFLDPCLVDSRQNCMPPHIKGDKAQLSNHNLRLVQQQDVFPNRTINSLQGNLSTLDLAYYPTERGPYNYDGKDIDANGKLLNPNKRWAGIMRPIDYSDFETANVEFIEFWLMDPYLESNPTNTGSFYINLGNVSEDILKDGQKFFENGLPASPDPSKVRPTKWSNIPVFQQQLTNAFDNDPAARTAQDVGYDGMNDDEERTLLTSFLDEIKTNFGVASQAFISANEDPANDNYHHFRGTDFDNQSESIKNRYKKFNNPQGNSPISVGNAQFTNSYTNTPESEDINRDNTLNENEQYFQYRIDIQPNMQVGQNFIVNKQVTNVTLADQTVSPETWYQFKVPIQAFTDKIGAIPDFRSIRFMRMFMTGFNDEIMLRFARLELGRNIWRKYNYTTKNPGEVVPIEDNGSTVFNNISVSVEENGSRQPIPYVEPPGIVRQQTQVSNGQNVLLNEQSISLQVCGLEDGDSRGVFKSLGMDLRQYKEMRMFIHAENSQVGGTINDGDLRGFIRLGSDFVSNYYEYQIPLEFTNWGENSPAKIWPLRNEMILELASLVAAKEKRNQANVPFTVPYYVKDSKGNYIKVVGNPNMGDVKMAMLGLLNPQKTPTDPTDDGQKKCAEIWFNELRIANLNEDGGWAAIGQADIQLADIATVKMSGNMYTAGYGNIDQRVNQRARENFNQFNVSTTVNAGKLLPQDWGVQLPVFAGYSQAVTNPVYDPYDLDVNFKDKLKNAQNKIIKNEIKKNAQTFAAVKSLNFQNVRIVPKNDKIKQPWDLQNFDVSYAYNQTDKRNPLLDKDLVDEHHGSFGYSFAPQTKPIEPFKKLISSKGKYLRFIKDFNFNVLPSNFTFRTNIDRLIGETQIKNIDDGNYKIPANFYKFFTWGRNYNLRWELTKSLSFDYSAQNNSRIDEPDGRINTPEKKEIVKQNISSFGRNTQFNQSLNSTYTLPTSKFPILDWTTVRAIYNMTYNFNRASLLATSMGNVIGNTQSKQLNGEFNFTQLYNKVKILRILNSPYLAGSNKAEENKKKADEINNKLKDKNNLLDKDKKVSKNSKENSKDKKEVITKKDDKNNEVEVLTKSDKVKITTGEQTDKDRSIAAKIKQIEEENKKLADEKAKAKKIADKKKRIQDRKNRTPNPPEGVRILARTLMMIKRANFNYTENSGTILPGYMDSTQYLGMNFANQQNPGMPFAFGLQPNALWLQDLGKNNLLTRDSIFNAQFQQQYSQSFNATASLEPFKDFRIDLSINKTFNKAHNELFKDTIAGGNNYMSLNPYETGGFTVSYVTMKTLFQKTDKLDLTPAFYKFENNRKEISRRLGLINPYTGNVLSPNDPEYSKGYTRYSQEVLIPAFLSAYRGDDAKTFPLLNNENATVKSNPFKNILPMPNWRINYGGLARNKHFKDIFQTFTLNHTYTGSLAMNSFNSMLQYNDTYALGFPSFLDSVSNNYIPYFLVPNMTITENFGPLIGIDATLKNSLNIHIEYKKQRTLSMSLIDFQLSETNSKEIAFGGGMRIKDVTLPIQAFNLHNMKSDMNIKFEMGLREDITRINKLDQRISIATRGQKVISFSPSVDYLLNKNVTIRFLYDRRKSIPKVFNSFPITTTRGGVMVRFMLGQ